MQPYLWPCGRHIFHGRPIVGSASQNRGRTLVRYADLPAEPLHFYLLERVAGAPGGNVRAGCGAAGVDDDFADRLCTGRVAVFHFDRVGQLDGRFASDLLVYCDDFWIAIFELGFCAFAGAVGGGAEYVDSDFCSRGSADDHGVAANCGQGLNILSHTEKVFFDALGRLFKCGDAEEARCHSKCFGA